MNEEKDIRKEILRLREERKLCKEQLRIALIYLIISLAGVVFLLAITSVKVIS